MSTNSVNNNGNNSFWHKMGFVKFGRWMKNNGATVGSIMGATGQAAQDVAMGAMMFRAMDKGSIFGGGCHHGGNGMADLMMMNYMMNGGGFGMGGFGMGGFGMGGLGMGGFGIGGDMYSMMGLNMAYQSGAAMARQYMMQSQMQQQMMMQQMGGTGNLSQNFLNQYQNYLNNNQTNTPSVTAQVSLDHTSNDAAAAVDENGDKTVGDQIDKEFDKLGKSNRGGTFDLDINTNNYATEINEHAKSYIRNIDSDHDGYLSEDEFVRHEVGKLPSNATDAQKRAATQQAKNAYAKLNRNNDSHGIDSYELGALFGVLDGEGSKRNGVITATDYQSISNTLADGSDTSFVKRLDRTYNSLFKPPANE